MKPAQLVAVVAIGGVAVYYLVSRSRSSAGGAGQGGGTFAGLGASLGGIPYVGPVAGAIGGAIGGIGDAYNALSPAQKQQLGDAEDRLKHALLQSPTLLNPILRASGMSDPIAKKRSKARNNERLLAMSQDERAGVEQHAAAMFTALTQRDVQSWNIDQGGTLSVYYKGRKDPFQLAVPSRALNPAAWVAEMSTRLFGSYVNAGKGPLPADYFPAYDEYGFTNENAFLPANWRPDAIRDFEQGLIRSMGRG